MPDPRFGESDWDQVGPNADCPCSFGAVSATSATTSDQSNKPRSCDPPIWGSRGLRPGRGDSTPGSDCRIWPLKRIKRGSLGSRQSARVLAQLQAAPPVAPPCTVTGVVQFEVRPVGPDRLNLLRTL